MFCKNCGKEIDDKAAVCVYCGVPTDLLTNQTAAAPAETAAKKINVLGIIGFVFAMISVVLGILQVTVFNDDSGVKAGNLVLYISIIVPLIAVIISSIGVHMRKVCRLNGFAIAGLVIGLVIFVIYLIEIGLVLFLIFAIVNSGKNGGAAEYNAANILLAALS